LEESSEIMKALYELLLENRVLSETIESILGPSAQLYELGSIVSDPGSERQMLHADYNYQPDFQPVLPPALTCFVALQDIESNMGPTTFLPSSATALHHQEIADRQWDFSSTDGLLAESPNLLSTLGCGDCSIYNPMTLHCGGANRSEQRRNIFYFSFKNPKFNEKDWPLAYASLSPDLRARALTLPDIHGILKDWNNKANVVT
jgi:ectoine hydroxylase-related dioxygenase (phytanoyl-CoA dioxygenase family)